MNDITAPRYLIDPREILAVAALDGVLDQIQLVLLSLGNGWVASPHRLYIVWPLAGELLMLDFDEPFGWIMAMDVLPKIIGGNATLQPCITWPVIA